MVTHDKGVPKSPVKPCLSYILHSFVTSSQADSLNNLPL